MNKGGDALANSFLSRHGFFSESNHPSSPRQIHPNRRPCPRWSPLST